MGYFVKVFEVCGENIQVSSKTKTFLVANTIPQEVISIGDGTLMENSLAVTKSTPIPESVTFGYAFHAFGKWNLIPTDETLGGKSPENALLILKTPVGFRGSNSHKVEKGFSRKEPFIIAKSPIYHKGKKEFGAGENLIVILPRGVFLIAQIHGIHDGRKSFYYIFDGQEIKVLSSIEKQSYKS